MVFDKEMLLIRSLLFKGELPQISLNRISLCILRVHGLFVKLVS